MILGAALGSAKSRSLISPNRPAASDAGFDLQLSGHTHGGQFVPWTWVAHLVHPIVAASARVEKMWVYVNRGTGTGPPVRLGSAPEITLPDVASFGARD